MKTILKHTVIAGLLFVLVWINIPGTYPVNFELIGQKVEFTVQPPSFSFRMGNNWVQRDFVTKLGLDLSGGSRLVFEADTSEIDDADLEDALTSSRNIIEQRVNLFGISEPQVQTIKSGDTYRISVELPGIQEVSEAVGLIGSTAQLSFRIEGEVATPEADITSDESTVATAEASLAPAATQEAEITTEGDTNVGTLSAQIATEEAELDFAPPLFERLNEETGLTGEHVKKATVTFDPQSGQPAVSLEFDGEGKDLFGEITENNVGKPVGIFLDQFLISAPTVQQPITDGNAIITGSFTVDTARNLAVSINSGALPVPIDLVEQRNIGPTLGEVEVQRSLVAGITGFVFVIIFMIAVYGRLGLIAAASLLLYVLISHGIFRLIPVVLTLPGITGFILSIGMAVDANVLIFERIKEEQRKGREHNAAIRLGFKRAFEAIKDANITTLLVMFVLFNPLNWEFLPQYGMVRGFALTLSIGVLVSLFTGIVITRRLITAFYTKEKEKKQQI